MSWVMGPAGIRLLTRVESKPDTWQTCTQLRSAVVPAMIEIIPDGGSEEEWWGGHQPAKTPAQHQEGFVVTRVSYPVLSCVKTGKRQFIRFWAGQYDDEHEHLYENNIGQRTPGAVKKLFLWKNGGPLSQKKNQSLQQNYVGRLSELRALPLDLAPEEFFRIFSRGGAIWRIFFLHVWQPEKYPPFDQHVYRAMCFLEGKGVAEIPPQDPKKLNIYVNEYLPFFRGFPRLEGRAVDKALWMFGRFLKSSFAGIAGAPRPKRPRVFRSMIRKT